MSDPSSKTLIIKDGESLLDESNTELRRVLAEMRRLYDESAVERLSKPTLDLAYTSVMMGKLFNVDPNHFLPMGRGWFVFLRCGIPVFECERTCYSITLTCEDV